MLARLSGRSDSDHLTRTTLKYQEITNANVVARNSNGIGSSATFDKANTLADTLANTGRATFIINDYLLTLGVGVMGMEWMKDAVCCSLKSMADGMVATLVVVVTHFGFGGWIDSGFGFDPDFFSRSGGAACGFDSYFFARFSGGATFGFDCYYCFTWFSKATLVLDVVGWLDASAVLSFSDIDFFSSARNFNVNLGLGVALGRLVVSMMDDV